MARRSKSYNSVQRDPIGIANRRLLAPYSIPSATSLLSLIEDLRTYHPLGSSRRPRSVARASDGTHTLSDKRKPGDVLRFQVPERVVVCMRRAERREVLFASRKAGKGSKSRKTYNQYSTISCKR